MLQLYFNALILSLLMHSDPYFCFISFFPLCRCKLAGRNREWAYAVGSEWTRKSVQSDQSETVPTNGCARRPQRPCNYLRYNRKTTSCFHYPPGVFQTCNSICSESQDIFCRFSVKKSVRLGLDHSVLAMTNISLGSNCPFIQTRTGDQFHQYHQYLQSAPYPEDV